MQDWKTFFVGKKVTSFGLGIHGGGIGTVRFLSEVGADVLVTDMKTEEQLKPSIEKLRDCNNVTYHLGGVSKADFETTDLVVISPAIAWDNEFVAHALKNNILVEMDASLFFRFSHSPIIGVTGTKGKTTTSTLIYEMLKTAGKNPIAVGIGQTSVLDKLPETSPDRPVVFELSSWRLSSIGRSKLAPHVAVFTNFFPDHLNYYGTIDKYLHDKKQIFAHQKVSDIFVANMDDKTIAHEARLAKNKVIGYAHHRSDVSDEGVFLQKKDMMFAHDGYTERIVDIRDIQMKGRHNIDNIMAASAAALWSGATVEDIRSTVVTFHGVAHRLEMVKEKHSIRYYNDTAATIPQAVIGALEAFTQPVVLIAGGSNKGLEYDLFARSVVRFAKDLVLFEGQASDDMCKEINNVLAEQQLPPRDFAVVSSMEEAVRVATERANKGDIVLLSPGAASFGLFENEFDRGDKFREAVHAL